MQFLQCVFLLIFRPDLIDYNNLNPHDHIGNLNNAFETAQKHLGIVSLLDAEGMCMRQLSSDIDSVLF